MFDAYFPLVSPMLAGIAALLVCSAMGFAGWKRNGAKVTNAWAQLSEHESTGTHPYRNPPRIVKFERIQRFVRAASITNSALVPGVAWCFFMCAISMSYRDWRVFMIALGLGLISQELVRNGDQLSVHVPEKLPSVSRRIIALVMLSLLGYGAIAVTFVAMARGKLNGLDFELSWFELTVTAPRLPKFISLGEHDPVLLQPTVVITIVHTSLALFHASLWLAAVVLADQRIANSDTRFRLSLGVGVLVVFAALVGVAAFLEAMPARIERMARDVYKSIERPCLLPPLPENATEVSADQHFDIMSGDQHVQFKVYDVTTYKRSLRETWYGPEIPSNSNTRETLEPPQWSEDVNHYSHGWSYGSDHTTTCEVFVDEPHGVIRIKMVELN